MEARNAPRVSVAVQTPAWRRFAWFGVPPLVVLGGMSLIGVLAHNPAMPAGALMALGGIAIIAVIEVPLILRMHQRKRAKLLASAPKGTIFVTRAIPLKAARDRPTGLRECLLLLDDAGISFIRAKDPTAAPDIAIPWQHITDVSAAPMRFQVARAKLQIVTSTGEILAWSVQGLGPLAAALTNLTSRWPGPGEQP